MYLYLWIVFAGFIVLTALPLFSSEKRTRWKIGQFIAVTSSVLLAIFAIEVFYIPPLPAIIFVVIVSFLADRSTYTKTGMAVAGIFFLLIAGGVYYIYHDDPEYVQNYINNNPELASMHLSVDGNTIISQEGDVKRPLASTVKTILAIEYANQVVGGDIDPEELIPLAELDKFYLANTDGGAHPAWLEEMSASGQISNNRVPLHEVAKGMIMFSSNANTDFLLEKLGAESINNVLETLELEQHDPVYPLVSALLIPEYLDHEHNGSLSNRELESMLLDINLEEYRELAWEIHYELKEGEPDFFDGTVSVPMELQNIWSDRLPNASVEDYAKVLSAISDDTATVPGGEEILRDLMEWPMELHASNREMYKHFGAKGGSTAFVLNQALYVEDHDGKELELIIFTEGFSTIEQMKMSRNMNSYLRKVLNEN
jgi:D-alanyl-D-alanine carboxypeptidase